MNWLPTKWLGDRPLMKWAHWMLRYWCSHIDNVWFGTPVYFSSLFWDGNQLLTQGFPTLGTSTWVYLWMRMKTVRLSCICMQLVILITLGLMDVSRQRKVATPGPRCARAYDPKSFKSYLQAGCHPGLKNPLSSRWHRSISAHMHCLLIQIQPWNPAVIQKSCRKSSPVVAAYHVRGNPKKKQNISPNHPKSSQIFKIFKLSLFWLKNPGVIGDHHPMRWGPMDPTRALELEGSHRIHGAIDHLHLAGHWSFSMVLINVTQLGGPPLHRCDSSQSTSMSMAPRSVRCRPGSLPRSRAPGKRWETIPETRYTQWHMVAGSSR